MYIISKNHDYYDGALAQGVDKSIIYERKEVDILVKDEETVPGIWYGVSHSAFKPIIIGFCGKIYYGLQYTPSIAADDPTNARRTFWSLEEILSDEWFVREFGDRIDNPRYRSSDRFFRYYFRKGAPKTMRDDLEAFFKVDAGNKYEHLFVKDKMVVFRVAHFYRDDPYKRINGSESVIQINPVLKDVEFYKVFDAYTAMQEIMMYIGGVLGSPNRPMIELKDVDILEAKGFDKKISFRQGPTKALKHDKRKKT